MISTASSEADSPSVDTEIGSVVIDAIDAGADVHIIAPDARGSYTWAEPWLRSLSTDAASASQMLAEVTDLMDARTLILPPGAPVAPVMVLIHDIPVTQEWADAIHHMRRIADAGRSAGVLLVRASGPQTAIPSKSTTAEWAERALELFGPGRENLP
ncbi:hypothetical protein [Microbacterium paraoxydans]|uniref:hypothetical protein n=1 Tax=Microbacterium paraoxydans TaxID=199592 RepID=UPI0021A2FF31|nr:hypothetical protein [Microbacterium paraoxydans]MCT2222489.1 hypothetical protein [Microbacterium paraoxydans]